MSKIVKKTRLEIEKASIKAQEFIKSGRVEEGIERLNANIHTIFDKAERDSLKAESLTDSLLKKMIKSKVTLLLSILALSSAGGIGYAVGVMACG